jgi:hypothetical protein
MRLQAIGRPDLPLKLYLIEIIPYVFCLWAGLSVLGVVGAALAWSFRTGADMILLSAFARFERSVLLKLPPSLALLAICAASDHLQIGFQTTVAVQMSAILFSVYVAWRQLPGMAHNIIWAWLCVLGREATQYSRRLRSKPL